LNRGHAKPASLQAECPSGGRANEIFMSSENELNIHESDQVPQRPQNLESYL